MRLKNLAKPLFVRKVTGNSMLPALNSGQIVFVSGWLKPKKGKIVVILHNKIEKIKRVSEVSDNLIIVLGDNENQSTDSRTFGAVEIKRCIGVVMYPNKN